MKIYTRTGDDGTTGLLGPGRVLKSAARVEAYGSVDELNAALGVVRTLDSERWLDSEIRLIQSRLFDLGAELATIGTAPRRTRRIADSDVTLLEQWIDRFDQDLPRLKNFILPGGTSLGAQLQFVRTVCRRSERRLVALQQAEPDFRIPLRYLNRLADLLFVLARWCNNRAGVLETEWRGDDPTP